jgi:hypothetical protein
MEGLAAEQAGPAAMAEDAAPGGQKQEEQGQQQGQQQEQQQGQQQGQQHAAACAAGGPPAPGDEDPRADWASHMRSLFSPPGMHGADGRINQLWFKPQTIVIVHNAPAGAAGAARAEGAAAGK